MNTSTYSSNRGGRPSRGRGAPLSKIFYYKNNFKILVRGRGGK